jgi:hypothetical protein
MLEVSATTSMPAPRAGLTAQEVVAPLETLKGRI